MMAQDRRGGAIMEVICDAIFNALYIILSVTILFAQVVVLWPACLRLLPFYKKSTQALDKLFGLGKEEEFPYPNEYTKVRLQVGYIRRGENGFKELLEAIKEYRPIPDIEVKTLGLAFGDIPIETSMPTPNFALFAKELGLDKPIYFNPWTYDDPSYLRAIFLDWVMKRAQTRIAKYTAIIITIWIMVSIYLIFIR